MPVVNSIAAGAADLTEWRRWLHRHPEIGFELHDTSAFVAARLTEIGVDELHTGIARTGIVALIRGRGEGPTIGLRADMDALPIAERTGAEHASTNPGAMHACGHDGHTTMLLGAARYLAETRNFAGTVALIFQPAEEGLGGARAMVEEGIMDRFAIAEVYGLHTSPVHAPGTFQTRPGPIMAGVAEFTIEIEGQGGHGAFPQGARDPIAAALQIGQALMTILARNASALDNVVVSICQIHSGTAHNIIPDGATLNGTVRTFRREVQEMVERRMAEICAGVGAAMGVEARLTFSVDIPATVNAEAETAFAAEVAREIAGVDAVDTDVEPVMGGEDFSFMLESRPGAFLVIGQGEGPFLHNPAFDFNDEIAPVGASWFARLVERRLPLKATAAA